jgi:hypothetical protein
VFKATLLILALIFSVCLVSVHALEQPKFTSLLIILDQPEYADPLIAWLEDLGFRNFTFAVVNDQWYGQNMSDYWLLNQTRLDALKAYGVLIPQTFIMQQYSLEQRRNIIDGLVDEWVNVVGYAPKGIFDFQPDTYTMNYCESKGFEYVTGYCFDQYSIDWMTERGGWQLPYYASENHVLMPKNVSGGLVVFPHQTWDWVSSFTIQQNLDTHPLSLADIFYGNTSLAKNYFLNLIDSSLEGEEPFAFAPVQFEWGMTCRDNLTGLVTDLIQSLLSTRTYNFWTLQDITTTFKNEYVSTPTYTVDFRSPYDNESIEWFCNRDKRVARVNGEVVSYINYDQQSPDRFLNGTFQPDLTNFSLSKIPDNCVDDSLNFTIDGLGGGEYRAPIRDNGTVYNGTLADFPNENSVPEIPISLPVILVLTLSMGIICFACKRKEQSKEHLSTRLPQIVFC